MIEPILKATFLANISSQACLDARATYYKFDSLVEMLHLQVTQCMASIKLQHLRVVCFCFPCMLCCHDHFVLTQQLKMGMYVAVAKTI